MSDLKKMSALDLRSFSLFVERIFFCRSYFFPIWNKIEFIVEASEYIALHTSNKKSMRALIQRVSQASVTINNQVFSTIENGLLVFLGIEAADDETDLIWLSQKITQMRLFDDENHVPNLSVKDLEGSILLVSQFTLHALTKKGNRPSYIQAARPEHAKPLYDQMILQLEKDLGKQIATGSFGADMKVSLINDGPITIWIDSKNKA